MVAQQSDASIGSVTELKGTGRIVRDIPYDAALSFDIESYEYARFWQFAQKVAKAQKKVITCERIGVAVIGLEVPHAHIHLVPLDNMNDINFNQPKLDLSSEEMQQIADKIRSVI